MNQWIYSFDSDINDLGDPAKLIGNKGVSLSLMTSLGLPVPEWFYDYYRSKPLLSKA